MLCRPRALNIGTVLMISHRFHRRKMDGRLSLEIARKTDTVSSLQLAAHRRCYFLLSFITVLRSAPNVPSLLRYKDVYTPVTVFSNSNSVIHFLRNEGWVIRILYLKRMLLRVLSVFGNSSLRLNFTTPPPRDVRGKMESFYLQMNWREQNWVFIFVRVPQGLFNIGNLYKRRKMY
jgi:hypothetical protein